VLVLYNVAILPFDAAFWNDVDGGAVRAARAVRYVTDAFFAVDIVLNFFTAYYDATERLVARRRDIVMHYLRTSFALDVLGSFPFELLVHGSSASLAAVVKFPRLLRMRRVYSFLENKESRSVLLFRIAQLAGGVLLAIHFVACAWFMICDADRGAGADDEGIFAEEDVFWCKRDELTTSSRYVFATHDAVSFLLGNGVGDGMYNAGARGAETVILRRDVKVGSMAIARDLPQSLKHELLLHFHSEVLRRVPMFANINEPSTVLAIVNKLKTEIALPGDLLIRRGEPSRGLFFINRGSAEVLLYVSPDVSGKARLASETQANETSPSKRPRRMSRQASLKISEVKISDKNPILRDGDYFGERGILLGDVPLASVLARTFCELHVLTTEDFTSILEFAPEIEEYMIRARLELFSDCEPTDARHSASPSADDVAGNISDENTKEAAIRRRLTLNRAIRRERLGTQAAELVSLNAANDLSDRLDRIESALNDIRRSSRVVRKL
jgi:CRP-like cAMP-binding protein